MEQRSRIESAVRGALERAQSQHFVELVSEETAGALQHSATQALGLLTAEATVSLVTAEAVCLLSRQCLAAASEAGVSCVIVAELVCDGLGAAAELFVAEEHDAFNAMGRDGGVAHVVLEALGETLDGFTIEIFAGLRRLEDLLRPRWALAGGGRGGRLIVAAVEASVSENPAGTCPGWQADYSAELRLFQALQGVCIWAFALAIRTIGYRRFGPMALWEFSSLSHECVVLAKGALSFQQNQSDVSYIRIPHDLLQLRSTILGAVLGLVTPDIAFLNCRDAENNEITMVSW